MAPKHFVCAIKTRLFIYVSKLCGVYEFQYTPEDPGPYSPNRREEKFSETGLPVHGVLGNSRPFKGIKRAMFACKVTYCLRF